MPDGLVIQIRPITYDETRHRFIQNGREISPEAVRAEIERLTEHVQKEAARIGRRYARKRIGIAEFENEMRSLLKSAHLVASSVGRGGRIRMTQSDWAVVGNKLKWQYGFLRKLANNLVKGTVARALTPGRAKAYASSILVSYYTTVRKSNIEGGRKSKVMVRRILHAKESCAGCKHFASLGWISVDEQPMLGELECGDYDRCTLEFSDDVAAGRI